MFSFHEGQIPYLTKEQMIEVDRAMIEDYRIELIQMMENAGRNLAHLARERFLGGDPRAKRVVVLAGSGSNGGGALVAARRLHNYGARVAVYTTKPIEALLPIPARQLAILHRMQVRTALADRVQQAQTPDLILDGVIGYSLRGAPRGAAADLIRWANDQPTPTLALDVPSGVDATSGTTFDPAIRAAATLTLALPKVGLQAPGIREHTGELYLADISVPPELYAAPALNLKVEPLFTKSDIIRLW
jgi:NAD(P)H-hydrate epimerase